jgi:hypothetical protein
LSKDFASTRIYYRHQNPVAAVKSKSYQCA